jgi:hypothetical protein
LRLSLDTREVGRVTIVIDFSTRDAADACLALLEKIEAHLPKNA